MPNKIISYKRPLKAFARKLRNESTLSEVLLWRQIRGKALGVQFHRQVPIDKYIVDFYCHEIKLAIEIDGCIHEFDDIAKRDVARQKTLEGLGVHFIRFNDLDVKKDMTNVIRALEMIVEELSIKKRYAYRRTSP